MAAMLAPSAMRAAHVRTAPHHTRACTCCADYSRGSAARERRAQRRREAAAWRREAERD